jgi:hypothetical protein
MDMSEALDKRDGYTYDPIIKGADTTFWAAITGVLSVATNKLRFNADRHASYLQHLYGDYIFRVNIPANLVASDNRVVGLRMPAAPTIGSVYFEWDSDAVFSAKSYDNFGNLKKTVIAWDSDWSGSEIDYRIRWERDRIQFHVNGVVKATHGDNIGTTPLPIDIKNENADNMDVGSVEVRHAQTIV